MNQLTTPSIVLSRTDYGEADRIITLLTPEYGKLRLMAKGVRKVKSKLAGGIELFSVSDVVFIRGRSDIGTLISARLQIHYGHIVEYIDRTMLGYELIKQLNRSTEDEPEPAYFQLLKRVFEALDDSKIDTRLIALWFNAQLLRLGGHMPNLRTDTMEHVLVSNQSYHFDADAMTFTPARHGIFTANHVKLLRLSFSDSHPAVLAQIQQINVLIPDLVPLVQTMKATHLHG